MFHRLIQVFDKANFTRIWKFQLELVELEFFCFWHWLCLVCLQINRTSELARVFGIDFFSVLSRGSQFRVESMLLRLAHTQNYLAISPGSQQARKPIVSIHLQSQCFSFQWLPVLFHIHCFFYYFLKNFLIIYCKAGAIIYLLPGNFNNGLWTNECSSHSLRTIAWKKKEKNGFKFIFWRNFLL